MTDELLDAFFAAITRGDVPAVDALYAPHVRVWHNITGVTVDKEGSLEVLCRFTEAVTDIRYEVLARHHFEGGVVQRHVLHGAVADEQLHAHVCIVIHVEGGLISEIYEYLDRDAIASAFPPG